MHLDPHDDLGGLLTLNEAAAAAGVTRHTINRWIRDHHLTPLPGGYLTERAVLECERDRYVASRQGRPGARVALDI
jgi:hypothetical protein